jgi:hypothetical protein
LRLLVKIALAQRRCSDDAGSSRSQWLQADFRQTGESHLAHGVAATGDQIFALKHPQQDQPGLSILTG